MAYMARFEDDHVVLVPAGRQIQVWNGLEVEVVQQDVDDYAELRPFPCRFNAGPVYVSRRLRSTRGGNAAWWRAGDEARKCLNKAPFEPVFRGWVTQFAWAPPADAMAERDGLVMRYPYSGPDVGPTHVFQGGSQELNWQGWVNPPEAKRVEVDQPTRGHLRLLLQQAVEEIRDPLRLPYEQGALKWGYAPQELAEVAKTFSPYRQTVHNHYFTGGGVLAQTDEWYLVRLGRCVLASDHKPEMTTPGTVVIAYHPVPTRQGVD